MLPSASFAASSWLSGRTYICWVCVVPETYTRRVPSGDSSMLDPTSVNSGASEIFRSARSASTGVAATLTPEQPECAEQRDDGNGRNGPRHTAGRFAGRQPNAGMATLRLPDGDALAR